jgi:hypothetical protein
MRPGTAAPTSNGVENASLRVRDKRTDEPPPMSRRSVLQCAAAAACTGITLTALAQALDQLMPKADSNGSNEGFSAGDVRHYGAVGDGITDDTAALQAALNSGQKYVYCAPGQTYLVRYSGDMLIKSLPYRYCLGVPAEVHLYGNGATIKLADAQNASIVAIRGNGSGVFNIVLDGNRDHQTSPPTGEMANVIAYDVERITLEGLTAKNVRQFAGRFLNCRQSRFVSLGCEDSYGDGWRIGTSGDIALEVFDSFVDDVNAQNCEGAFDRLEGNGCVLTTVRCEIGRISTKNCSGGLKLQNTSVDNRIGLLTFDGGDQTIAGPNSGVKIQGSAGFRPNRNFIQSIVSRNAYGNGLFVREVEDLQIVEYLGVSNGSGTAATGSARNDVDITVPKSIANASVRIARIAVERPNAVGVRLQGDGRIEIESIQVINPTGRAVHDASAGELSIGGISAIDGQASPTMTHAFQSTGSSKGRIETIDTSLNPEKHPVSLAAGQYGLEIGRIGVGDRDDTSGVIKLARGRSDTSVACGLWCDYVGGACDYFRPVIHLRPMDQSVSPNDLSYLVADGRDETGFVIMHPHVHECPETEPPRIAWNVAGWRVTPEPMQAAFAA